MSKENFKSLILLLLVMINFILGSIILTDKKLWPDGYNFFSSFGGSAILKVLKPAQSDKITKTHITMPEQIIVNTGDQTSRIAVKSSDENFYEICTAAEPLISDALKSDSKNIYLSKKSEWVSVLGGKSLCFYYPVAWDIKLFGEFFDLNADALYSLVPSVSRILIASDNSVYFEDFKTGNFYCAKLAHNSKNIVSLINKLQINNSGDKGIINYSVDLKFDEALGEQKAVLSPTVPVYSTPVKMPALNAKNPLSSDSGLARHEIIEKILPIFKINTNTVRRYSEVNGTLVFVENNGILKIHPNGVLYYQSTDSNGFSLGSGDSYSQTINALADFADSVNTASNSCQSLYISSPMSYSSDTVTFDYYANGTPVKINFDGHASAIKAEIINGALKSYTHVLRGYRTIENSYTTPDYIAALDSTIEKYAQSINNIEIRKIYLSYMDNNASPSLFSDWYSEVKSIEIGEEELR